MGLALDSRKLQIGDMQQRQKGLELELVDARIGAEYRALRWLSLQIEVDFPGNVSLKDAFVRVESKRFRGQFGQFKMPVSSLTMESPWKLPLPDRGFIQDILDDHVQLLGRRQGAIGRFRAGGKMKPELTLGLFQGRVGNTNDEIEPDLQLNEAFDSQNAVARAGIRLFGVHVGVVGERISTRVALEIRHFWAAGLDANADYDVPWGGVRFWVEGFTGTTWHSAEGGATQPEIQFATTRGVVAVRWGGLEEEQWYLEPFALGALLDPDLETHSDLVWEAMLGVNVGAWRRFRLGLCGLIGGSARGVPDQLFVANAIRDRKRLELQVGAAF